MSGRGRRMDERIVHTVTFSLRCPGSPVPEVMQVCKYTLDKSANWLKQMAIRRSFDKYNGGKLVAPAATMTTLMTTTTMTTTTTMPMPMPMMMTDDDDDDNDDDDNHNYDNDDNDDD